MPTIPAVIRHDLIVRRLEVIWVRWLGPRLVRVRLGGPEMEGFTSLGPTDHVKLRFPDQAAVNGSPPPPAGIAPVSRDYTVRRHEARTETLDLELVVHGDGPASAWAASAEVGSHIGLAGPRGSHPTPIADHYLLIGDMTALPAIRRWAEELPPRATARVLVAAVDAGDVMPVEASATVQVQWLFEDSVTVPADLLGPATARLSLPPSDTYAWAAGEVIAMRSVRRALIDDLALDPQAVSVDGYWRRGVAGHDHHAPLDA